MREDSDYVYVFTRSPTLFNNRNHNNNNNIIPPPPSYEEAIAISINPSSVNITPAARSAMNELEQISISHNETTDNNPKSNFECIEDVPLLNQFDVNNYNIGSSSDHNCNLPPEYTVSDAEFETSDQGVTSLDSKINSEVESLHRFFIAHNDKPQMAIKIHGYYTNYETENYSYTDSNGQIKTSSRTKEIEVTDFKFTFDLTNYITPYGKLHIIPNKKYLNMDIMEFLREYVENKNLLKEIEMRKVVIWDYDSLTKAISSVIRQQGYNNTLRITYPIRNYIVKVQSDHKFSKLMKSKWFNILCIISCLWIILWPLTWLYKKSYKDQLRSDFQINISPRDWFQANVENIISNVQWR
ncbi:3659_t:CDS:2 [Diversispora eburnea]|uniref:3659_t:CDS:1 n=1 Tax=Diversispora eburnea TaxID=1213867 RepID=A0A9N9G4S4_9GLOM|nr:3659_t:CDS:2 [Diversispora eburnea]